MTPMTMDERIEAGLVAMMEAQASSVRRDQVRAILAAAFPELTGDKPTHQLARIVYPGSDGE